MTSAGDTSRVVAALNYLRSRGVFFEFDDQERVIRVCIDHATGADEIASHVGNLQDLEKLRFSRTDLTDDGLRELAKLERLRELWIGGSRITEAGLANLGAMSQLEYLNVENARDLNRAAFACIGRIATLRELSICGGSFCDGDLAALAALVGLEELRFSENENINASFCEYLVNLPQLQYLSPGQSITDVGLASIAKLTRLETLFLEGPFNDAGLGLIYSLKRLSTLYITSERVSAQGLAVLSELPDLTRVGLDITVLHDACIPILARCKSLASVTLFHSTLTAAGRKRLRRALPNCEIDELS